MHARQTGSQLDTCTDRQEVGYNALILPLSFFFLITQSLLCSCFFSSVSVSPSCLPAATPTLSSRDITISSLRRSPHSHFLSASRPQTHLSVVSMMSHPEVLTQKPLKATCRVSKSWTSVCCYTPQKTCMLANRPPVMSQRALQPPPG